ncbi:hypothetical protein SGPA1_60056 [Streptomyces misionensis JCM 4497]
MPAAALHRPRLSPGPRGHRGRARRRHRRLGHRRRAARHRGAGRGGGAAAARPGTPAAHPRRLPDGDPQRRPVRGRGDLLRQAQGPRPRSHLQGVRAAEVPRPAPGPGLHPGPAAPGGVGLRLLRRHPDGRRARTAAAGEARPGARVADRHRAERRLPIRYAGEGGAERGEGQGRGEADEGGQQRCIDRAGGGPGARGGLIPHTFRRIPATSAHESVGRAWPTSRQGTEHPARAGSIRVDSARGQGDSG